MEQAGSSTCASSRLPQHHKRAFDLVDVRAVVDIERAADDILPAETAAIG